MKKYIVAIKVFFRIFYWINPIHKAVILEAPLQFLALPIMKMNASKETKPNPKHEVGTKWFLKPFSVTSRQRNIDSGLEKAHWVGSNKRSLMCMEYRKHGKLELDDSQFYCSD